MTDDKTRISGTPSSDFPVPENDKTRVSVLRNLNLLDSPNDPVFDDLALLASQICDAPIALISLVDTNRQWFKARVGLEIQETERSIAFCSHAILEPDEIFIVPDTTLDDRFKENPLVTVDPLIRFYMGAPLVTKDGFALGTLCVMDIKPRTLSKEQISALSALRRSVMSEIELRRESERFHRMYIRQAALAEIELAINQPHELQAVLDKVVEVTKRLLPASGGSSLILWEEQSKSLRMRATTIRKKNSPSGKHLMHGEVEATRWIMEHGKPVIVKDIRENPFNSNDIFPDTGFHAFAGVPLVTESETFGVLYALDKKPRSYKDADIRFLSGLASRAATAIHKVKMFEELQRLSIIDELTGVNNRRHFFELARLEFIRAVRYGSALSAIMLDLDHFKKVNDTFGHAKGDTVLKEVIASLREKVRESDLIGRYGGDEFVLLLPNSGLANAIQLAERLRSEIEKMSVGSDENQVNLTITLGVAAVTPKTSSIDDLIESADQAMYAAKSAGRNCVRWPSR